jgi:hypothetical protein
MVEKLLRRDGQCVNGNNVPVQKPKQDRTFELPYCGIHSAYQHKALRKLRFFTSGFFGAHWSILRVIW